MTATDPVWLAAVTHRHGTNLYAGRSEADLQAQLAAYCRQWWLELSSDTQTEHPSPPKDDPSTVMIYFQDMAEHGDESLTVQETELC